METGRWHGSAGNLHILQQSGQLHSGIRLLLFASLPRLVWQHHDHTQFHSNWHDTSVLTTMDVLLLHKLTGLTQENSGMRAHVFVAHCYGKVMPNSAHNSHRPDDWLCQQPQIIKPVSHQYGSSSSQWWHSTRAENSAKQAVWKANFRVPTLLNQSI